MSNQWFIPSIIIGNAWIPSQLVFFCFVWLRLFFVCYTVFLVIKIKLLESVLIRLSNKPSTKANGSGYDMQP